MVYYFNRVNEGLISASSLGDGYTINLKWNPAYPQNGSNKVAYQIYMSTVEDDVFTEGPKFVSIDGSTSANILDLTPGQLYFFAVRAIEYNPVLFDTAQLPVAFNNLVVYPQTLLTSNIGANDTTISAFDVSTFPSYGVIQLGYEMINYLATDNVNNNFILTNVSQRGFFNTRDSLHDTDGYDGVHTLFPPTITFTFGREELNTRVFPCQSRFEYPHYSMTITDGYKQVTKDLLTTNLIASDAFNEGFPSYDYAGYHRTLPADLLTGVCVGSYIGGQQFCADGYGGVGRMIRGLSLQNQNLQRQEMLLNVTGEPVCLLSRQQTGIICSCYTPSSEYADDRCQRCFVPGTLIRTDSGYKKIEEININDKVLSSNGKYVSITNIFINNYDGYVKSIITSTTAEPIICTPDHPFLMLKGSHKVKNGCGPNSNCKSYIERGDGIASNTMDIRVLPSGKFYARARVKNHKRKVLGSFLTREEAEQAIINYKSQHIKLGHTLEFDDAQNIKEKGWLVNKWNTKIEDMISIKIPQEFLKNTDLGNQRNGDEEFIVDEDFMWIVGIYLAEGCPGTRSITFALHEEEVEYQNKIIDYFSKYGFNGKIYKISDSKGVKVEIYSTSLSKWFPSMFGHGCENKNIPEIFMNLPNHKTMSLIKGIFDGDGCKRDQDLGQTSKILALQIGELLHRNGKKSLVSFYENKILTENGNKRKTVYHTNYEKENFNHKNRKGTWQFYENLLTQVNKVEDVYYSGKVYNLEVEGDHTYVVQNVLVHNCYGTKFVMGYQQFYNPRRSDGRILIRFSPAEDDLKMNDAGLESEFTVDCWTLTVPTIKDRDVIVRFDQDDNEEYRYEVLYVNRNKTIEKLSGAQKFRVQRIRKFDPAYNIRVFRNTEFFPQTLTTTSGSTTGIPAHTHSIVVNENTSSLLQINQTTGVMQGHSHDVIGGVVQERLGHTHTIILP